MWISAGCCVGNSPCSFLVNIEFGIGEKLDKRGDDVVVNDGLDLIFVSSGNVGYCPACFLSDSLFGASKKCQKTRKSVVVDGELCLKVIVISSHDISNGSKSWGLHGWRWAKKKFDKVAAYTSLNDPFLFFISHHH